MNLHTELDKQAKQKELKSFFEDNYRLKRVPLDELQTIEALFPLVRANFKKSWANVYCWEYKILAYTKIDGWEYQILLGRDNNDYTLTIEMPSRVADFEKPHFGELHDDKVADLIDEVEEIVREIILEKQKQNVCKNI